MSPSGIKFNGKNPKNGCKTVSNLTGTCRVRCQNGKKETENVKTLKDRITHPKAQAAKMDRSLNEIVVSLSLKQRVSLFLKQRVWPFLKQS